MFYRNTKLNKIEKVWICRENILFTEIRSLITLKKYEYTEKISVLHKYGTFITLAPTCTQNKKFLASYFSRLK